MAIIARLARAPVYSERKADDSIAFSSPAPSGWSIWASDGRILPPAGVYLIDAWGAEVKIRRTSGTYETVQTPTAMSIQAGEAIAIPAPGTPGGVSLQRIS